MSSYSVFIKCNECNVKPATIKCFECKPYGTSMPKMCYTCDSSIHSKDDKLNHNKEIIPYKEMY